MIENMLHVNIKSVTNLTLIILIAAAVALSGCADVTAPETTIDSLDAPGYYNDDINELAADIIHNTERTEDPNVFEKGGMKIRLEKYDGTEEIYAITYTDHVGNSLIVKENDNSNGCIVDEVHIINEDGTTLVPKPQAEAVTPVGAELYKELLAQDNPEEFKKLLGMDINDLKITGLGTPDEGSLKVAAEGGRTTLRWDADYNENLEPKTGLTKYIESYDGRLTNLMFKRGNDGFGVLDKKGNDEKIDMVEIRINSQEFQFES